MIFSSPERKGLADYRALRPICGFLTRPPLFCQGYLIFFPSIPIIFVDFIRSLLMNIKSWPVIAILAILAAVILYHCGSYSPTSPQPPSIVKEDPSFASDIQPIFSQSCISSSCHGNSAAAGLILLQGQSYANLVDVPSTQEPGKRRVIPNDATNSYLVIKLEGRQTNGGRMPLGESALNANSVQNIKNWINKGAKNN